MESVSRNGFSIIYVWMKWGTDLNAAQTLVQQNAAFAMAAALSAGLLPARKAASVRPVDILRGAQ